MIRDERIDKRIDIDETERGKQQTEKDERGGKRRAELGNPDKDEDNGKPDKGLSPRGLGTNNRTDPVYLGLQKTRLLDPTLNFLGTNDQAGDYRSSGCTSCHAIYANDRSPVTAVNYASAGNEGRTQTSDPMIPKNESGHPIKHVFHEAGVIQFVQRAVTSVLLLVGFLILFERTQKASRR